MHPRERGANDPKAESDAARADEIRALPCGPTTCTQTDQNGDCHTPTLMAVPNEERNDSDVHGTHPMLVTTKGLAPFNINTWPIDYERQHISSEDGSAGDSRDLSITAEK